MIAGGGTGGHLFPALAVAEAFKERDPANRMVFVGSRRGLESSVLAREGYELKTIEAAAWKGKKLGGKLGSMMAMPRSLGQSWRLLHSFRPDLVLGFGGYASGPVVLMAWAWGYKTAIHEQNAFPGTEQSNSRKSCGPGFPLFRKFGPAFSTVQDRPHRKPGEKEDTARKAGPSPESRRKVYPVHLRGEPGGAPYKPGYGREFGPSRRSQKPDADHSSNRGPRL